MNWEDKAKELSMDVMGLHQYSERLERENKQLHDSVFTSNEKVNANLIEENERLRKALESIAVDYYESPHGEYEALQRIGQTVTSILNESTK